MTITAYRAYQESRIPWMPEVPSHWTLTQVRREAKYQIGGTPPTGDDSLYDGDRTWVTIGDLKGRVCAESAKKITSDTAKSLNIPISPKGSLLFSFKLSVGQVAFAGDDIYTNEAIATFLPESRINLSYAYYAFPLYIVQNASENIYGAKLLNRGLIQSAPLAVPPRDEQIAIAAFLDHETGWIDSLIAEQQRLIALLDEKRQAVISHAVTKGLAPNVEMKDSGIEWLGEVPAHWQLKAIKSLTRIKGGSTPDATEGHWDGDVVWYSPSDLTSDTSIYASSSARTITAAGAQSCSTNITPAGSVVLSTRAPIGSVKISSVESCTNQGCKTLVPIETSAEYLYYVLLSAIKELNLRGRGTTFLEISGDALGSLVIPVPPKEERDLIAETLSHEMGVMRTLQDESRVMLSLLRERRSALISAAVTGKIDVRNHPAAVAALNGNKD